jgi:hypothetical protein
MPILLPSLWADNASDDNSIGVDDMMPVVGLRPQKVHNGHSRAPIRGPRTMTQSPVWTSRATTPPGKHVTRPGKALAIKEASDGHITGPWTRTRSPVRTAKATMSLGKHVTNPGKASAIKEAADNEDDLRHGMALLQE